MPEFRFKLEIPYLTEAERRHFERLRKTGKVSFFRTAACSECGAEIPNIKEKPTCSKECHEKRKRKERGKVD